MIVAASGSSCVQSCMFYSTAIISLICDKCHNSKFVIFQEKLLKVLKCYNFLWVQRRHNCSPAANFANGVMTLYLLKVHLQTSLSISVTQKCQILSCYTLVANERCVIKNMFLINHWMEEQIFLLRRILGPWMYI